MRIGASFALIGIGAVLKFAVTQPVSGISLGTVGVIMMILGVVGLLVTLALMSTRRRTDVVYGPNGVSYVEPVADPHLYR
jgi:xanthine/uracil/vitamin C permease (AzgA family)